MKRVYVVTSGEYSDYRIEKIFSKGTDAHLYSLLDDDRRVEEYVVDDTEISTDRSYLKIRYNYKWNSFDEMTFSAQPIEPHVDKNEWSWRFEMTLPLSDERIYRNVMRYGKNSKVIAKIVYDRFAQYLYEHNTSRDELKEEENQQRFDRRKNHYYPFYSTSLSFEPQPFAIASKNTNAIIHKMMADGQSAPPYEEVVKIYLNELEKKEHE